MGTAMEGTKESKEIVTDDGRQKGIWLVLFSYIFWGAMPVFWKLLEKVDSLYILFSRVAWSLVFCVLYLSIRHKWGRIRVIFRDKKVVLRCLASGIVVCVNWGSYIWAVNNGHVLDSSFGYYMNPILVVILGVVCFQEKLSVKEWASVLLTVVGVLYVVVSSGTVPVLAVVIGGSFAIYGMIKKGLTIGSDESLFMETLLVSPVAVGYLIYAEAAGFGAAGVLSGAEWTLLPLAGIITAIPLLTYAAGVQKVPFYVTGMIMYLNPTIQFLMGIFLFKEPVDASKIVSFVFIWAGVVLMMMRGKNRGKKKA